MRLKTIITCSVLLLSFSANAQSPFSGIWEGKLGSLRILDSPDQGANNIACNSITVKNDSIYISMMAGKARYEGRFVNERSLSGAYKQSGHIVDLQLKKTDKGLVINRPQEPKPPFDYSSDDVSYTNADKSITYGATITVPKGKGPFPALLLITGSGPQNRDEEIFSHKPFAVIADHLTKKGYVVLRVDDRGTGSTTGDFSSATSEDFMYDAMASLAYLRSRSDVDKKKVGLLGHSEGGMIAPMIAAKDKNIDFIVMLAGPGIKNTQLMAEQNKAMLEKMEISKAAIDKYLELFLQIEESTVHTENADQLKEEITKEVKAWRANTSSTIVSLTTHVYDDKTEADFVNTMTHALSGKWHKYFLSYDIQPTLKKLSCKVLALNGEKDIQVVSKSNLAGIKMCLEQSKSKKFDVIELKGLNHLFQECNMCTIQEYGQIEQTISPTALETISAWLDKNVK